jgi:hypothetical protein
VAGTSAPPFLSRDGQDIVHENPEQKYLNANKIIEIQKETCQLTCRQLLVIDKCDTAERERRERERERGGGGLGQTLAFGSVVCTAVIWLGLNNFRRRQEAQTDAYFESEDLFVVNHPRRPRRTHPRAHLTWQCHDS